jgi:hypothetical protein
MTYLLKLADGSILTEWHFDGYDGPRNHVAGRPLSDDKAWSAESLAKLDKHVAELLTYVHAPSRTLH